MAHDYDTLSYWQRRLDDVTSEIAAMVGAVSGNIGRFSVDQSKTYQDLLSQQNLCETKINALGGTTAGTTQRQSTQNMEGAY